MYIQKVEQAITSLKQGQVIIVTDDDDREAEGDFIGLADYVNPEMINLMATEGRGLICTPITNELADKLAITPMVSHNTDNHQTAFTVTIDHIDTTTGISAGDRALTIKKLLDKESKADDFRRPGHVFPIIAKDAGVIVRNGHTEASIDLAKLAGCRPVAVICEIMKADGTMARHADLQKVAKELGDLTTLTVQDIIDYRYALNIDVVKLETSVKLPTKQGEFMLHAFSSQLNNDIQLVITSEHFDATKPVLTRIHSECFTGDVLSSLRCDCNEQLNKSLAMIAEQNGMLVYLRQEGRGIGLLNKLKAYKLQEQGFDTIEANQKLGLPVDARNYGLAASILHEMQVTDIRLITNNPDKIAALKYYGINITERVVVESTINQYNNSYLVTKKNKIHHLINNI